MLLNILCPFFVSSSGRQLGPALNFTANDLLASSVFLTFIIDLARSNTRRLSDGEKSNSGWPRLFTV
jgi:hypothetical protein